MTQRQFNFKLDPATAEALKRLAEATQRSQASVIRWLVHREAAGLDRATSPAQRHTQEVHHEVANE